MPISTDSWGGSWATSWATSWFGAQVPTPPTVAGGGGSAGRQDDGGRWRWDGKKWVKEWGRRKVPVPAFSGEGAPDLGPTATEDEPTPQRRRRQREALMLVLALWDG